MVELHKSVERKQVPLGSVQGWSKPSELDFFLPPMNHSSKPHQYQNYWYRRRDTRAVMPKH